ncbi:MAG: hypothetical protein EOO62_15425 [Hymenobacter sp.]|nr:MAG: hypothetical protein EOO62_15425 [Hymenobacter sp.]
MPIQAYTPAPFELEVCDLVRGQTQLKQKVRFLRLEHDDQARTATVHVLVLPFAVAPGGGYGEGLTTPPFLPYADTIVANNNRLVDMRSGAILAERYARNADGTPATDVDWQAVIDRVEASEVPAMYQGDYFLYLRDNQPLIIGEVIRQYIRQADAAPSRYA